MNRVLSFLHFIPVVIAVSSTSGALAGEEPSIKDAKVIQQVVYPLEALLTEKRGKVEADFTIDRRGQLMNVTILKSDAPEFSEAVRAYADATDFSIHAVAAWKTPEARGQDVVVLHQSIEFDERIDGKRIYSISTPSTAALEVLKTLRSGPATKEYGGANNLDVPLRVVSNSQPVFPKQLQETHQQGSATVEFYVGKDGRVLLPRAVSATDPAFGYSACQSVASWRFNSPMRNGNPVVVRVRIPINYSLNPAPGK